MKKPIVKLIGTDSNAFSILARCRRAAIKYGWDDEQINNFYKEAIASDYYSLLAVCGKYFDIK